MTSVKRMPLWVSSNVHKEVKIAAARAGLSISEYTEKKVRS